MKSFKKSVRNMELVMKMKIVMKMKLVMENKLNQKYFSTWQSRAWETSRPGMSYINVNRSPDGLSENRMVSLSQASKKLSELVRDYAYLMLTSQTSMRSQIIGFGASELNAQ